MGMPPDADEHEDEEEVDDTVEDQEEDQEEAEEALDDADVVAIESGTGAVHAGVLAFFSRLLTIV